MKLSKIFLLIPAFMMIGCKGNAAKVDPNKVDEDTFNGIFQHQKLFKEENVKVTNKAMLDEVAYMYGEAADGKLKLSSSYETEPEDATYIEFLENDEGYIYSYKGEWIKRSFEEAAYTVEELLVEDLAFVPFDYSGFEYKEDTKAYVGDQISLDIDGDPIIFTNVEIRFNENKLIALDFDFYFSEKPSENGSMRFTFEYGDVSVTLPEVNE